MPTKETQIAHNILASAWEEPVSSRELSDCFQKLANHISETNAHTHLVFNIEKSGSIPAQAPFLFIRSNIMKSPNLGRIVVVGHSPIAKTLAQMAVKMTTHTITFFDNEAEALEYLKEAVI